MAAHFIGILLAFLVFSVSSQSTGDNLVASIDCGTSGTTSDENDITWSGDESLNWTFNGESHMTPSKNVADVMSTMRVFKSLAKNCYSFKFGNGIQVLVRASFFYGNYDNKATPPTFDLYFDTNKWTTVVTTMHDVVSHETIYIVTGYTSVCLVRTHDNQFPFISALEVRKLKRTMYRYLDSGYALLLQYRVAFGADDSIRYPTDDYDRIWKPEWLGPAVDLNSNVTSDGGATTQTTGSTYVRLRSTASSIVTSINDDPPQAVLQNAIGETRLENLNFTVPSLSGKQVPAYINFYFNEVEQINSSTKRYLYITVDDAYYPVDYPLQPVYSMVTEYSVTDKTVSNTTSFQLYCSRRSDLPVIMSAMEVFSVQQIVTNATETRDVDGLRALQAGFSVLQQWSGDPCLPAYSKWDWIKCSNASRPRVTALYLSAHNLTGLIPDFNSMDVLETIDLSYNQLNGVIPNFLGELPKLKLLNLTDNIDLNGTVPSSLWEKVKNKELKFVASGCIHDNSCNKGGNGKLAAILGAILPTVSLGSVLTILLKYCSRKRRRKATGDNTSQTVSQPTSMVTPLNSPIQNVEEKEDP